jgi:hypothetical protein
MSSAPSPRCPECGAPLSGLQARCWLCQRKPTQRDAENPYAPPQPIADENAGVEFSLASLFLVMTLVVVCFGTFMIVPGLGILLAIVSTPALIRTIVMARHQRRAGAPLSAAEKIGVFLISWFVMGAIGLASMVAFLMACFTGAALTEGTGANLELILLAGILVGLAAAIPLSVWLLRLTRPANLEYATNSDRSST